MVFVAAFAGGLFLWTFMEYALHNWAGHLPRGKGHLSREHLAHHARTNYFTAPLRKAIFALPVLGVIFGITALVGGLVVAAGLTLGTALGWLAYEVVHRRLHTRGPRGAYARWACRHHFYHHFQSPRVNHGVTSPLWDIVFRTHVPVREVRVPRKQAAKLPWLLPAAPDGQAAVPGYRVV